jgi:hypothetical protein
MKIIMIVKTWCENTKEGRRYLKYHKYGKFILKIPFTEYWLCFGVGDYNKLTDVKICK